MESAKEITSLPSSVLSCILAKAPWAGITEAGVRREDRMAEYIVRPIGVVRSALKDPADAPKQGALTGQEAEIVVDPEYIQALEGLERRVASAGNDVFGDTAHRNGGKIIVICWMHRADRDRLKVHPRGQEDRPERGVFSTRSPHRPNPVSLHTVTLLSIEGNVLRVRGMDAIDGTPVVDIKPHSPELDDQETVKDFP
jgi:L-fuculose-phosphate aldolase